LRTVTADAAGEVEVNVGEFIGLQSTKHPRHP